MKKIFFLFLCFIFSFNCISKENLFDNSNKFINFKDISKSLVLIKSSFFGYRNLYIKNSLLNKKYINKLNFVKNFKYIVDRNNFLHISLGTGIIIDKKNGYIITNNHVIGDNPIDIKVKLHNGKIFKAMLVGSDKDMDISILKINNFKNISSIKLGDLNKINIGDRVYSLGYPYNLGLSVTSGIISGFNRNNIGIQKYEDFIQTDAIINSGNSGGALVNNKGELIGINTAVLISKNNNSNLGISFSIPFYTLRNVINQIIKIGEVKHIDLGFSGIDVNNFNNIDYINSEYGILISDIYDYSLLKKYKIYTGDIIVSLNNDKVLSFKDFYSKLSNFVFGDKIKIGILRNNKLIYKCLYLFNKKNNKYNFDVSFNYFNGVGLSTYNYLNLFKNNIFGVYVGKVFNYSKFFNILKKNDIILKINNSKIKNLLDLRNFVFSEPKFMLLKIIRNGKILYYYYNFNYI